MKQQNSCIDEIKMYTIMRSLYRFSELTKMDSPDIIINNEKTILFEYLKELTAEQILYLAQNFNKFYREQSNLDSSQNDLILSKFNEQFAQLN